MWAEATDDSWALHREHIRAGRQISLYGQDLRSIYPAATWEELELALESELYFVEKNLAKDPAYCILNLCRLVYSFETGDVVISKAAAAEWAAAEMAEWKSLIDMAVRSYLGETSQQDHYIMQSEAANMLDAAKKNIGESRKGANEHDSKRMSEL